MNLCCGIAILSILKMVEFSSSLFDSVTYSTVKGRLNFTATMKHPRFKHPYMRHKSHASWEISSIFSSHRRMSREGGIKNTVAAGIYTKHQQFRGRMRFPPRAKQTHFLDLFSTGLLFQETI